MRKEVSMEVTVPVSVQRAWEVWADLARYPEWMDHLERIDITGKKTSRWHLRGSTSLVAWETETTVFRPGEELAWSSVDGSLVTYGRVRFEVLDTALTKVVFTRFHATGRKQDKSLIERFGDPEAKLRADLEGFVRVVTAVPRTFTPDARPTHRSAQAPAARKRPAHD